jgi:hypothetical protein
MAVRHSQPYPEEAQLNGEAAAVAAPTDAAGAAVRVLGLDQHRARFPLGIGGSRVVVAILLADRLQRIVVDPRK